MQKENNFDKSSIKIAYVLSGLSISGGVAVILQHANRLMQRGYDVTLLNFGVSVKKIDWFHNKVPIVNVNNSSNVGFFDLVIATHFSTVKIVKNINSSRKIYFVQSDERRFNTENINDVVECEMSYKENFEYMTEAIWIQRWLKDEFGHDAYYVPNGLDPKIIYKTDPLQIKKKKPRVLLEGPISVAWKGMDDAYNAVKDLNCEIWIVSSCGTLKDNWKCDNFFYRVPFHKMKDIYSSCDIFLKMSRVEGFFGPPMEAMACGCAVVVGKVTGYDEYIKNDYNSIVVEQGSVNGAKKAVQSLIDDQKLKEKLIINGFETASKWDWDKSIDLLEKVIKKQTIDKYYTENFPEKYNYNEVIKNILFNLVNKDISIIEAKKTNFTKLCDLVKKSVLILKRDGLFIFIQYIYKFFIKKFIN